MTTSGRSGGWTIWSPLHQELHVRDPSGPVSTSLLVWKPRWRIRLVEAAILSGSCLPTRMALMASIARARTSGDLAHRRRLRDGLTSRRGASRRSWACSAESEATSPPYRP